MDVVVKRRNWINWKNGFLLTLLTGANAAYSLPTYNFTTINDPNAYGGSTHIAGINNEGAVVGYYMNRQGINQAFEYANGVFTDLNVPNAPQGSYALGINDNGQISGYYADADGAHGFIYNGVNYVSLNAPLAYNGTKAGGINNNGQVVGVESSAPYTNGFVLTGSTYSTFNAPGASATYGQGINNQGDVVGHFSSGTSSIQGFQLSNGVFTVLQAPQVTNPNTQSTYANGINDAGVIAGYYVANGYHGFILTDGVFSTLDDPLSGSTRILGINNENQVVGFYSDGTGDHGFIATPTVPLPPSAALFLSGVLGVVGARLRRNEV